MVSPGGAAADDPPRRRPGPSLQDVIDALRSPDAADESRDDAADAARDDDDDDVSPSKFLQGLFDDEDEDGLEPGPEQEAAAGGAPAAAADPPSSASSSPTSSAGCGGGLAAPLHRPLAALAWDDNVALSFPSARRDAAQPPPPELELVASSSSTSCSRRGAAARAPAATASTNSSSSGSGPIVHHGGDGSSFQSESPSHLVVDMTLLEADEIEQLATGMLEMGSPIVTAAASASAAAATCPGAGPGVVPDAVRSYSAGPVIDIGRIDVAVEHGGASGATSSRMRMASSWHLGPGANANPNAVKQENIGIDANASSSGRRVLPLRKARCSSGMGGDEPPANSRGVGTDGKVAGTKRRSSGESAASVASVTSADGTHVPGKQIVVSGDASGGSGDDGSDKKKRKKSGSGSSGGGAGGSSAGRIRKSATAKNKRKKAEAIAKKAAENLELDLSTVPQRPKQGPNTFLLFCNSNRNRIKAENPDVKGSQMNSILGEQWRALSDRARKPYIDAAAEAAREYAVKMEAYNTAMERFHKTDDGRRWVDEQDRLLRQSVEEEGGVWKASMGIATKEKDDEEKAIAAVVAAAATVKAQENRKLEAKAALKRQEEERIEQDRRLFGEANMDTPPAPVQPKSAFAFFRDALYEKRRPVKGKQLQIAATPTTSGDDSSCPAILYDQLPQQKKEVYESMASKAQKSYRKAVKEYEQQLVVARSRAREIIDMLDPAKRAAKVEQMVREVAAVRKQNAGDAEWFQPDRQRLVRHQLDWRLRHAAKAGCTHAEFLKNLQTLYTRETQKEKEKEERRRLEQLRLQKEAEEKKMKAKMEKMRQLQEQMQRAHQLQHLETTKQAMTSYPYPALAYSQAYYPHQAYPWGVMMPTQMGYFPPTANHVPSSAAAGKAADLDTNNPLMALAMLAEWNDRRGKPSAAANGRPRPTATDSAATAADKDLKYENEAGGGGK